MKKYYKGRRNIKLCIHNVHTEEAWMKRKKNQHVPKQYSRCLVDLEE